MTNNETGIGARGTKFYHEKSIHEQNLILQSFHDNPKSEGVLEAGIHRWPFQFLLTNQLVETIEDEMAKVFYYLSATVHRTGMNVAKPRARRDILLLRIPHWSNDALAANSLPSTSIFSERQMETCDVNICIEKSNVSSGTRFPIAFTITPNIKHLFIESVSVILTEKRSYRLPEFNAKRVEFHDFKVSLFAITSLVDPDFVSPQLPLKELRRALNVKNAHIPLDKGPFRHRLDFSLPNCVHLNHTSTFSEISIRHTLKIHVELSHPEIGKNHIYLDTPITILDCRLKEDYNTLPTYEEAILVDPVVDEEQLASEKPTGFFACPCYLEYKKKAHCNQKDWMKIRNEQHTPASTIVHGSLNPVSPPPYESIKKN